jgi:hypothetical protein
VYSRRASIVGLVLIGLAGCDRQAATSDEHGFFTATGPTLAGESSSGRIVRVQLGEPSPRPGRIFFHVESPGSTVASADLVSPTMPSHGIRRLPAVSLGPDLFLVDGEAPMAGDWLLYVNFDEGSDAAEFPFSISDWPGPSEGDGATTRTAPPQHSGVADPATAPHTMEDHHE